ncbi:uncharacterized protein PAE49_007302 [Odontesthes bonariensis]|uniref:uncharacterized protein LOC142381766 n=1 Tax=Odontesthes bonariensis TaxID=219752 RepID=UPI003F58FEA2
MTDSIIEIKVSMNVNEEEQLRKQGFTPNPVNLNKRAGGNKIYVWYKRGSGAPITRIQVSYDEAMTGSLKTNRYIRVNGNLNAGTGGDGIYLWYTTGSSEYDIPIVDLFVSTEPQEESQLFQFDWERLSCNLNRKAGGSRIYLWVRREKPAYICDITATANFKEDHLLIQQGYIRVDENTNRGAGGKKVFIWYRQHPDRQKALTDLQISTNTSEMEKWQRKNYKRVDQDLNEGTTGPPVYLFYCKTGSNCGQPIKTASLIIGKTYSLPYERAGIQVIQENLNTGNDGAKLYLCFYQ